MRRLVADVYRIVYLITNNKLISLFFAIAYISLFHLIFIYGLSMLVEGVVPGIEQIRIAYTFPYYIGTVLAMLAFNFIIMLPLQHLSKYTRTKQSLIPLAIYSLSSVLIFLYIVLNRQETL